MPDSLAQRVPLLGEKETLEGVLYRARRREAEVEPDRVRGINVNTDGEVGELGVVLHRWTTDHNRMSLVMYCRAISFPVCLFPCRGTACFTDDRFFILTFVHQ